MSKAQNRSKGKPSNVPKKPNIETKPSNLIDIVPGKFNENDWYVKSYNSLYLFIFSHKGIICLKSKTLRNLSGN